jgi:hypothetical protein
MEYSRLYSAFLEGFGFINGEAAGVGQGQVHGKAPLD